MDEKLQESALKSFDGTSMELLDYIPYLLQDLWELGSNSKNTIEMIYKNEVHKQFDKLQILDLGCGKGGISIPIAKEFNAEVLGIDAMKDFIEDANRIAKEWGVEKLCKYVKGDIRKEVTALKDFNFILHSSIGQILGSYLETLNVLEKCLMPGGFLFLDDAYLLDNCKSKNDVYLNKSDFFDQINKSNFKVIDIRIGSKIEMKKMNELFFGKITQRADELCRKHPEKKDLFNNYLKEQIEENQMLENDVENASLLLGLKD
mgnify:CR=1 FL=1